MKTNKESWEDEGDIFITPERHLLLRLNEVRK